MLQARFYSPSLLQSQFPIQFANGHRVETIAFWCKQCSVIASPDTVHGSVSRIVANSADVRAVLHCSCGHVSHYTIRLKDDKSYDYLDDGYWHTDSGRRSLLRRVWFAASGRAMMLLFSLQCRTVVKKLKVLRNRLVLDSTKHQTGEK